MREILDQVIAEGGNVVADEFQDSFADRGTLLEKVDDTGEQRPAEVDRSDHRSR